MTDESTDEATVTVIAEPAESDTPAIETGDTTVIVETPVESTDDGELDPETVRYMDHESRIAALEMKMYEKADYEDVIAIAEEVAEESAVADEAIVDATDEAIVEAVEDADIEKNEEGELEAEVADTEPVSHKVHPLFRPWGDWKRNS